MKRIVLLLIATLILPVNVSALGKGAYKKCVVLNMAKIYPNKEKISAFYDAKGICDKGVDKKEIKKQWRGHKNDMLGSKTLKEFYKKYDKKEKKYQHILLNKCITMEFDDILRTGQSEVGVSAKNKAITWCSEFAKSDDDYRAIQSSWLQRRNEIGYYGKTLKEEYKTTEKYFKE